MIDIDRLHKVHLGEYQGRGCGKSTLFASYLIGISQLDEYMFKSFNVLFHSNKEAGYTIRTVKDACEMMNVKYEIKNRYNIRINSTSFVFCKKEITNMIGFYYIDEELI